MLYRPKITLKIKNDGTLTDKDKIANEFKNIFEKMLNQLVEVNTYNCGRTIR